MRKVMTSDLKSHHFHHFHIRISHISLRQTHWTEKPVADMTTRDWRIFREDPGNSWETRETPGKLLHPMSPMSPMTPET